MGKGSGKFFVFLAGAAAGAALGILFAPDKGKNTRDKLSFQLDKYKDKLLSLIEHLGNEKQDNFSSAKYEGERIVNDTKDKAEKLLVDVEDLISQIRNTKPTE